MRHSWSISDSPDLPIQAFRKALGKNRPETLEGGKGGSAPQAPDPYNISGAQGQLNQQAAAFNKALNLGNYSNPFGSQQSQISGYDASGAPIYQTNISTNDDISRLIGSLQNQAQNSGAVSNDVLAKYQQLINSNAGLNNQLFGLSSQLDPNAAQQYADQGRNAYYQQATSFLDPQYAQQEESLGAKLAAQGLSPGSQAYTNAMGDFNRNKSFAYNQAQQNAITQGQQMGLNQLEAQRQNIGTQAGLFGQIGSNLGQMGALAGQQLGVSQLPYNNLNAIGALIPRFTGAGSSSVNPADIASAMQNQYLGQLGQYNARQQGQNATASNLAGLFGNLGRANSLYNMFSGNGLAGYGSALSGLSPGLAGSLGDTLGMSIGGTYGAGTQAGLDALLGSFNAGAPAAAAGGAAEAGAAGAGAAGGGAGVGGAGAGSLGLAAATAAPFLIAAGGMLGGLLGYSDNGTPYTRANDAWANAITKDPSLLQQYGQGDVSKYMQSMFGGSQWTPEQYQRAQDMLSAAAGGGSFFGNFLGAPEQGMGG